jgi:hypothetical protein
MFQEPADKKTYLHLRLFGSDEDAEDYDKDEAEEEAEDAEST